MKFDIKELRKIANNPRVERKQEKYELTDDDMLDLIMLIVDLAGH